MDYRFLGRSGFKVPALGFGIGTFGGKGPLFSAWGSSSVAEAKRLVDICLDAGANLFDSADVYSDGASEEILGAALKGRRERAIVCTKLTLCAGDGSNDVGWKLTPAQMAALEAASAVMPPYPYYPYWNGPFAERNPPPVAALPVPTESNP